MNQFKIIFISLFIIFVALTTTTYSGEKNSTRVQGLFYLDGEPISVVIEDGRISQIIRNKKATSSDVYIAPGLIDVQLNGYAGVSFTQAGLTLEEVRQATRALWKEGVTTYLPTIISASHQRIKENMAVLSDAHEDDEIGVSIPGFFLEGPYISPIDGFRGAHSKEWVRQPDWDEFMEYYEASGGNILQVTLAPEMENAMEFIRKCTARGILVGLGHHNGSAEIIKQAVDAGARISTHLGNGCANTIHRHHNPLWAQLADDRLNATIIVDGHHLTQDEVQVFYKAKGPDRILLVSDVTKLAGMAPGEYNWDGKRVVMTPDGMLKYPEQDVLAGASLPIRIGVGNLMKYTHCPLSEAIHAASRSQARVFGFSDRGEILPGKRADLILFTIENNTLHIIQTIVAGVTVFQQD
ncbi:N-acetylglucosamine-6-phosphate deacetylase [candidate division KSB1 bacterium]|nr:N-acetylglucosamine-6-phosphate deacetylase [candidate division KSB1 bacterium]